MMKNKQRANVRKATFLVTLSVSVIVSFIFWLIRSSGMFSWQELLLVLGLILVVGFALFRAFVRLRAAKEDLPAEDELSKQILRRSTAGAYHASLLIWLVIMYFSDKTEMACHTLIGAGILGMAIAFALSWIFFRYIRQSND